MDGRDDQETRVRARRKAVLARRAAARPLARRGWGRRRAIAAGTTALAVFTAGVATTGGGDAQAAPVGRGFTITAADLSSILGDIQVAEHHVASATPANPCAGLSTGGLRTVDGSCNDLRPGHQVFGAADQVFPRLTSPDFRPAEASPADFFGPGSGTIPSTSYAQSSGVVFDDEPRTISNLVVDQSSSNPASAAAGQSAYNSLFTIFSQFFDHGLHKIRNGGNGTVYVPLRADDPSIAGPDHVVGTADDLPTDMRFMVLTRGTNAPGPGPDGVLGTADDTTHEAINTDSTWIDLSQTYASHPSHQVFLREYALDAHRQPQATGRLLGSADGSMATWSDVKNQAATELGLQLADTDVNNIPMLAADAYGNFIPGPNGLPQYVTASGLVEGNLVAPIAAPADVRRIDTAFLNQIAHSAVPTSGGPDTDAVAGLPTDVPSPAGSYDDELLDQHVIAGDGRANENIGLTAIHTVFEHEHNRLIDDEQRVLDANAALRAAYQDTNCASGCAHDDPSLPTTFTYGERLFQASRFVNEIEYEHLVFADLAGKVQPTAAATATRTAISPAITAEFALTVSRFADSMLDETIPRTATDGTTSDIPLAEGSLDPATFKQVAARDLSAAGGDMGSAGAGAIIAGLSDQVANGLDEFVTDAVRNNPTGAPLDLAAINIARARSEGIPTLNNVRKQLFAASSVAELRPYGSWIDFGMHLEHTESLINFVAAYAQHPTIRDSGPDGVLGNSDDVTTIQAKRDAARALVDPGVGDVAPADTADFMNSRGAWANTPDHVSTTGVDDVDLWVGGLAEATSPLGGLLGTTFNEIFQLQLTQLGDADRLSYLDRDPALDLRGEIDADSLTAVIMRNTTAFTLNPDAFVADDCNFIDVASPATSGANVGAFSVQDDPATECDENVMLLKTADGQVKYRSTASTTPPPTTTVPPTTAPPTTVPRTTTTTTVPRTTTTTTPPTTQPPTTQPPPTTVPPTNPPSHEPMPVGDLPGWKQIFTDDFTKDAPLGSFDQVYATKWSSYIGPDTSSKIHPTKRSEYNTDKVVSVHGGIVDKYLHTEFDQNGYNGPGDYMMAAALLPKIPGQLHGRYTVRLRAEGVDGYKVAWLLWPDSGVWPRDGEIDFAETDLVDPLKAFIHRQDATDGSDQTACRSNPSAYLTNGWHTVTLEWSTTTKIYVDGVLECSTVNRVPNTPMHLVLQTESELFSPRSTASGHLYLDWVAVYKPA